MTVLQVALLTALVGFSSAQLFNNGFINPLFLPRGLQGRGGRLYDPYTNNDLRNNALYLSRGSALQDLDYRGLPYDPRYDSRRYPNRYNDYQRYPSRYDDLRRYPSRYDDYRRYPLDNDRRYNDVYRQNPEDALYLSNVGLATTARPVDRVQVLDRGQGLDRGLLSTSNPELAVPIEPNSQN